jgi:hypothetical protein
MAINSQNLFFSMTMSVAIDIPPSKSTPSAFYCTKSVEQTLTELQVNPENGLTLQEVDLRRLKHGV